MAGKLALKSGKRILKSGGATGFAPDCCCCIPCNDGEWNTSYSVDMLTDIDYPNADTGGTCGGVYTPYPHTGAWDYTIAKHIYGSCARNQYGFSNYYVSMSNGVFASIGLFIGTLIGRTGFWWKVDFLIWVCTANAGNFGWRYFAVQYAKRCGATPAGEYELVWREIYDGGGGDWPDWDPDLVECPDTITVS